MADLNIESQSRLDRFLALLGNPLEWCFVNKVLIILTVNIVVYGFYSMFVAIGIKYPRMIPDYMISSFAIDNLKRDLILLLVYGIYVLIALWLRRHSPNNKWFAYSFAALISVHGFLFLGSFGYATNPHTFLVILAQAFVGVLLFNISYSMIIFGTWGLLLIIRMSGELSGVIRYAPYMVKPPFMDGKIDGLWLFWNMGAGVFIVAVVFILCAYTINRWHKRETEVIHLSELLKKMFGRYLSIEVMNSLIENPSALELGGERRKVTIMMTDLRGFTAMSERLEPEIVVQMLNSYFEVMVDVVLKYNGTINEIIGDALLVIFGAPQEMPDRTKRAIACAIEMQNAMVRVNHENREKTLPELEMGIGLNEDEVIIGNIGSSKRSKYTVVGSGVNMASRIESYTVGGQIFISESVKREAGEVLRIDDQKKVMPKGAEAPLTIYEVGGIGDQYNLVLEDKKPAMLDLVLKIPLRYTEIGGKHVGKETGEGRIIRLSKRGCMIELDRPVPPLTNLKMNLGDAGEELGAKDFYGKVIEELGKERYAHIVGFTAVPPEVSSYFQSHRQHALEM